MNIKRIKKFKDYCGYLYQQHPIRAMYGLIAILYLFIILLLLNRIETNDSEFIFAITNFSVAYIVAFLILLPFVKELLFYHQHSMTLKRLKVLKDANEDNKKIGALYFDFFMSGYDNLRTHIKDTVKNSKSYLVSHNQEISNISQDIDLFFDVTTKIFMKTEGNISKEAFKTIENFLKSLDKLAFEDFKLKNITLTHNLFDEYNVQLEKAHEDLFLKTKNNIKTHYSTKQNNKNWRSLISKDILPGLITNFMMLLATAISAIAVYYIELI